MRGSRRSTASCEVEKQRKKEVSELKKKRAKKKGDEKTNLQSSSSTRDTESQSSSLSNVRVVTLGEELNDPRDLGRVSEEDETESGDGSSSNVVRHVRDGNVEDLPDGLVVRGSSVGHGDGVDSSVSESGVLRREAKREG